MRKPKQTNPKTVHSTKKKNPQKKHVHWKQWTTCTGKHILTDNALRKQISLDCLFSGNPKFIDLPLLMNVENSAQAMFFFGVPKFGCETQKNDRNGFGSTENGDENKQTGPCG